MGRNIKKEVFNVICITGPAMLMILVIGYAGVHSIAGAFKKAVKKEENKDPKK